jgi:hypothetical protein
MINPVSWDSYVQDKDFFFILPMVSKRNVIIEKEALGHWT